MHATYPVVVRHHPGWFGVLAGLILGVALTIAGLLVLERINVGSTTPAGLSNQAAAQLYRAHQAIEYAGEAVGMSPAELYRAHQAIEYGAVTTSAVTPAQMYLMHQAREYAGESSSTEMNLWQQFLREHQADMNLP